MLLRIVFVVVNGVVAVTAIAGGFLLAAGLETNRFPIRLLSGTPFHSYVVPGLILAVVVGGSALVAVGIGVVRSVRAAAAASVVAGIILAGWTVGEVVILSNPSARSSTELFYFVVGVAIATLGAIVSRLAPAGRGS